MIKEAFDKLKIYCEQQQFKGWDPYDGLNSKLCKFFYLHKSRIFRLAIIQFNKLSPINFRNILLVPQEENPKGLALFLTAYCNLYKITNDDQLLNTIHYLAKRLIELQSTGYSGSCWGYNFDWQSRAFYLPKYTPTVVASSFVAYSLMDAFDVTSEKKYLDCAISSQHFVLNDLIKNEVDGHLFLSYSPLDNSIVYNASLLGARLLSRIYYYTKNPSLIETSRKIIEACFYKQNLDGSWFYGELPIQKWIDSFHTGYNLESIYEYIKYSNDTSFLPRFEAGLNYYMNNFITSEGIPKYYHDSIFPVDPHALAQYIRTMYVTNKLNQEKEKIHLSLSWIIKNMQSPKGYFYYQKKKHYIIKIPYIRWTQAWMMYGLSFYLLNEKEHGTL